MNVGLISLNRCRRLCLLGMLVIAGGCGMDLETGYKYRPLGSSAVERRGYTLVPLELYWKEGRAKLEIGLAKGKKQHDKRAADKDRDWQRDKGRIMKAMRRYRLELALGARSA